MTPEAVIADLSSRFDDVHPVESWGETALFHNPDGAMKRGVYFATVKRKDGAHDRASALDRAGADVVPATCVGTMPQTCWRCRVMRGTQVKLPSTPARMNTQPRLSTYCVAL